MELQGRFCSFSQSCCGGSHREADVIMSYKHKGVVIYRDYLSVSQNGDTERETQLAGNRITLRKDMTAVSKSWICCVCDVGGTIIII